MIIRIHVYRCLNCLSGNLGEVENRSGQVTICACLLDKSYFSSSISKAILKKYQDNKSIAITTSNAHLVVHWTSGDLEI